SEENFLNGECRLPKETSLLKDQKKDEEYLKNHNRDEKTLNCQKKDEEHLKNHSNDEEYLKNHNNDEEHLKNHNNDEEHLKSHNNDEEHLKSHNNDGEHLKSHNNDEEHLNHNNDEEHLRNSDYYKRNELPVDRGWAWAVCFGGFLTSFNLGLAGQTMAILFLEVIEMFDTKLTTGSLIFLFSTLAAGLTSPVAANFVVPRLGEKCVVCIGGCMMSMATIGYYLAPSIEVFFCCAALKGTGTGLIMVPSISLLRYYFHRRRSIAQIMARCGESVSGIVMPTLVRLIRKEYGVRGAFLVLAALELHVVLGGLLLRPVKTYKFKPDLPPLIPKRKRKEKSPEPENVIDTEDAKISPSQNGHYVSKDLTSRNQKHKLSEQCRDEEYCLQSKHSDKNSIGMSVSAKDSILKGGDAEEKNGHQNYFSTSEEIEALLEVPGKDVSNRLQDRKARSKEIPARSRKYSTASIVLAVETASAVALDFDEDEDASNRRQQPSCGKYDFFQLWSFYMLLLVAYIGSGNIYVKIYMPTIAASQGATLDQAAILLVLMGVTGLVSQLCVGLFTDTHILKPSQIVAISHIVFGVLCQLTRFFTTFPLLILMSVSIALVICTRISIMPLIVIEVAGLDMMPQAFSIVTTITTFSVAVMNPTLGAVADMFGSFVPVMHIVGVLFFMSATVLLLLPLVQNIDNRKRQKSV
ncbi:hypothetical protein EGW08_018324, partial [Elysia chlorotica]